MKGVLRHSFEFLLVIGILVAGIILLEIFRSYTNRLVIISFLSTLYVIVGIVHHWEEKNLKLTQVLEHLAVGVLIFIILQAIY